MTVRQAAKHFGVSRSTIYRWIRKGKLSAYKKGRSWRITLKDAQDDAQGGSVKEETRITNLPEFIERFEQANDFTESERMYQKLLDYAREHYPIAGVSLTSDFYGVNLFIDTDMPNAPVEAHLADSATLALNSIQTQAEIRASIPIYEMGQVDRYEYKMGSYSFGVSAGRSVIRDDHSFWQAVPTDQYGQAPESVDMRFRARPSFRPVFNDGSAHGESKSTDWCGWSEWYTVNIAGNIVVRNEAGEVVNLPEPEDARQARLEDERIRREADEQMAREKAEHERREREIREQVARENEEHNRRMEEEERKRKAAEKEALRKAEEEREANEQYVQRDTENPTEYKMIMDHYNQLIKGILPKEREDSMFQDLLTKAAGMGNKWEAAARQIATERGWTL